MRSPIPVEVFGFVVGDHLLHLVDADGEFTVLDHGLGEQQIVVAGCRRRLFSRPQFDLMMYFAQWKSAVVTGTARASSGIRLLIAIDSRSSTSRTILALPRTRGVFLVSGTRKITPTNGWRSTFRKVSARRLPGRSGTASAVSSSTWARPAGSPFGEMSIEPAPSVEATRDERRAGDGVPDRTR